MLFSYESETTKPTLIINLPLAFFYRKLLLLKGINKSQGNLILPRPAQIFSLFALFPQLVSIAWLFCKVNKSQGNLILPRPAQIFSLFALFPQLVSIAWLFCKVSSSIFYVLILPHQSLRTRPQNCPPAPSLAGFIGFRILVFLHIFAGDRRIFKQMKKWRNPLLSECLAGRSALLWMCLTHFAAKAILFFIMWLLLSSGNSVHGMLRPKDYFKPVCKRTVQIVSRF